MTWQLIVVAGFFLSIGVYVLARPANTLDIMNIPIESADGRNEMRAVYGGMCLAIGGALLWAPSLEALGQGITIAITLQLVGMVLGRLWSFAAEHKLGKGPLLFLALEAICVALLESHADISGLLGGEV